MSRASVLRVCLTLATSLAAVVATACLIARPSVPAGPGGHSSVAALPTVPAAWPSDRLELGMADGPGGAAAMQQTADFAFRYQYLAGGVNTGNGWSNWNANAQFVTYYVQDSIANGITPLFTYYMMYQSSPGTALGEYEGNYANMQNLATMTAYYNDVRLFFQRAGAFPSTTMVLHVEPDLWGYMQQRSTGDNAATVAARVASTGLPDLAGLPNTVAGFAQAIVQLRDLYAPNVLLGYHMSGWGTMFDIVYSDPPNATIDILAARSAAFYASLGTPFDVTFAEFSDRDSGFKQHVYGDGGASWWDAGDFQRNVRYLTKYSEASGQRIVMWQIPYGNTKMRAMNNTWNHYQDNRVEWLLDEPARTHLHEYREAGVLAFLFGGGAAGVTCPCDAAGDGVTNPAPINGNTTMSLSADDDGGFFRQKAAAYYATGALPLASVPATPTPTRTQTATPTPSRTPTPDLGIPPHETIVPLP
jgi:hypothetical protein